MAVLVPSALRMTFQPQVWMAMRWWNGQPSISVSRLVVPPSDSGMRWWTWQLVSVQPGNPQWTSRRMTARRRCGGMVSQAAPTSRGRLIEAAGPEPGGQSAGPGQQRDGIAQDQLAGVASAEPGPVGVCGPARSGIAGRAAGRAEQAGGERAEELMVDGAGEDRRDRGVAQVTRGRQRAGPGPGTRQRPGQVLD